ncbi:MAG: ComEC/Rec2 family competence protein, partial [Solirubrobacterales bacterium]|nr:ComEC/Rec2 family competence protein [Solirubrobacterales bacterium]
FGQASLVGLPANLLAAPAVAPVMWLGVLAGALGQLAGPGGAPVGVALDGLDALAGFPLGYLAWVGRTAAAAPGSVLEVGPLPVTLTTLALLAVASSTRVRRALPILACLGAAAWVAVAPAPAAPVGPPTGFRLTFLDVGQGDATLLQDSRRSVLVDTGPPEGGIVTRLRQAGVERLEMLVLTHAQRDHDGAAAAVVDALPVAVILDGREGAATAIDTSLATAARRTGTRVLPGRAGQRWRVGSLALRVLWPPARAGLPPAGEDPNDRAIVLEAEAWGARALLTADAESDILARLDLRPVDLLKVAHHGSADPGLPALLSRLRPQVAGVEVGKENPYGHPAPATLDALVAVPAVVRTDRDGSVRVERGRTGWELRRVG